MKKILKEMIKEASASSDVSYATYGKAADSLSAKNKQGTINVNNGGITSFKNAKIDASPDRGLTWENNYYLEGNKKVKADSGNRIDIELRGDSQARGGSKDVKLTVYNGTTNDSEQELKQQLKMFLKMNKIEYTYRYDLYVYASPGQVVLSTSLGILDFSDKNIKETNKILKVLIKFLKQIL